MYVVKVYTIASQLHEWYRVVQYQSNSFFTRYLIMLAVISTSPLVLPCSIVSTVQWQLSLIEVGLVGEQGSLAGHH